MLDTAEDLAKKETATIHIKCLLRYIIADDISK